MATKLDILPVREPSKALRHVCSDRDSRSTHLIHQGELFFARESSRDRVNCLSQFPSKLPNIQVSEILHRICTGGGWFDEFRISCFDFRHYPVQESTFSTMPSGIQLGDCNRRAAAIFRLV